MGVPWDGRGLKWRKYCLQQQISVLRDPMSPFGTHILSCSVINDNTWPPIPPSTCAGRSLPLREMLLPRHQEVGLLVPPLARPGLVIDCDPQNAVAVTLGDSKAETSKGVASSSFSLSESSHRVKEPELATWRGHTKENLGATANSPSQVPGTGPSRTSQSLADPPACHAGTVH